VSERTMQPEPDSTSRRPAIIPIACDEVLDLMPALALGAIETGPELLVRQHCETCVTCAGELLALERVTRFLPFAAPLRSPSPAAKTALLERIAAPVAPAAIDFDAVIVDSPADKRRTGVAATSRTADLFDWIPDFVSGRTIRFAAAPLALALVFVSLYGLGALDRSDGAGVAPTAQAAAADVIAPIESSAIQEVTLLSAGTSGASATSPAAKSGGTVPSSFMARSNRTVAQTEVAQAIEPRYAECEFERGEGGSWDIHVNGVSLPNLDGPASVALVSTTGELLKVGDVTLDESGNGIVRIQLDQPLTDFTTIQISAASPNGGASPLVSFPVDLAARLALGLGRPD